MSVLGSGIAREACPGCCPVCRDDRSLFLAESPRKEWEAQAMITHILFSILGVAFVLAMLAEMGFGGKRADRARSRRRHLARAAGTTPHRTASCRPASPSEEPYASPERQILTIELSGDSI